MNRVVADGQRIGAAARLAKAVNHHGSLDERKLCGRRNGVDAGTGDGKHDAVWSRSRGAAVRVCRDDRGAERSPAVGAAGNSEGGGLGKPGGQRARQHWQQEIDVASE